MAALRLSRGSRAPECNAHQVDGLATGAGVVSRGSRSHWPLPHGGSRIAHDIGFLVVGVLGLFLLSCKSIARQPWWRSKDKLRDLLENAATNIGEAEFTKTLSSWHMSVTSSETICGDFESRLQMKAPRLRRGTHTWRNCCADPTSAA